MKSTSCVFCHEDIDDPTAQAQLHCCSAVACKKCLKGYVPVITCDRFVEHKKSEGCIQLSCPNEVCRKQSYTGALETLCDNSELSVPLCNCCPHCWTDKTEEKAVERNTKCVTCQYTYCQLCRTQAHSGSCIPRTKVLPPRKLNA